MMVHRFSLLIPGTTPPQTVIAGQSSKKALLARARVARQHCELGPGPGPGKMMERGGVFVTTPRSEGAERMPESDDGQERGIRIKGWEIKSRHSSIADSETIDTYEAQLQTKHLPELLFSSAGLDLKHVQSQVHVCFTAFEALRSWKLHPLPPIQVRVSRDWQQSRIQDIQDLGVKPMDYDWTFTTPYAGHVFREGCPPEESVWRDTSLGIDRELLMRRDPILFYDEFDLFESELDDHGMCKLTLKMRVMPTCWYVLARYWLRVDDVLVRCYDTRVFCALGDEAGSGARVIREVKQCEASLEALSRMGPNASINAHSDPEKTAQFFESIAPSGMGYFKVQELRL